jgi:hypothetical protein
MGDTVQLRHGPDAAGAVYALYRPHGTFAAGALTIAAGAYEFTRLKQHFRLRLSRQEGENNDRSQDRDT